MSVLASARKQDIPPYQGDDDVCPVCKSDRYLNKSMKLLVSPCYHKMCESCVERLFSMGPAPCPVCQQILRKSNFYQQIFEDLTVEKEVRIRKRVAMTFNKRQEDFRSLAAYNDYLEMVEDITFNLLNDLDIRETEERIKQYKRENAELISRNISKLQREEKLQHLISEQERMKKQQQREEYRKQLQEEEREKKEAKDSLIDALATSDKDAREIVHAKMIQLKKSSLSHRGSSRKTQFDISSLLNDFNDSSDNDDDDDGAVGGPFDPAESPYAPIHINLRESYVDPNPAFRQGILTAGGVTREIHQRYVVEGALSGLFAPALAETSTE
ncbi:CDK-activating kinase assembly factor [Martensiomyces pterosporus]|nr:CDK-activating kinase assembly factor [Martensiomyces pterosporus]